MVIYHNQEVHDPWPGWYLAACSTPTRFVFLNAHNNQEVIRTPEDGWTYEDANSLHVRLLRWDFVTLDREKDHA